MSDDLPDELLDPEFQEKQEQQEKAERGGLLGNNLMRRSGLRLQELRVSTTGASMGAASI